VGGPAALPELDRNYRDETGDERRRLPDTTFYLKKPDEERAYEAETVDYTVEDDDQWYVRYDASRPTHG
jgi:hypothetical protein